MASKPKFFSWSKGRQSSAEPYHKTGGLLFIDTSVADTGKEIFVPEPQSELKPEKRRVNLTIRTDLNQRLACLSPASARQNTALVSPVGNLLTAVNGMLRSPAFSPSICPKSAIEIHNKPLPTRPRSSSEPASPDLPVELPGSILLENQGFVFPAPPGAGAATKTMKPTRSGNTLRSNAAVDSSSSKVQHRKSVSESGLRRQSKSRPNLLASASSTSTDSKITSCSLSTNGGSISSGATTKAHAGTDRVLQPSPLFTSDSQLKNGVNGNAHYQNDTGTPSTPTPTSTRSRQVEELKATVSAQDTTITTLQTQFGSLRKSHEAHVASLLELHATEVASLKNYTRVLEEQHSQSQRTLHHTSSNNLLFVLDTSDQPLSPTRENAQNTAGNTSATSTRSLRTAALEQPANSPQSRDNPAMEDLRRKLSEARRPEIGQRELVRELNQYKQNHGALQKQVESLMATLNESKQSERMLKMSLERTEEQSKQWQEKAEKAGGLEKSTLALQNTVDHLEYRLEMANCEKVDAEEQLHNLRAHRDPFDTIQPSLQIPQPSAKASNRQTQMTMSTIFSNDSPISHDSDSQHPTTLAAFVTRIERLEKQIEEKDARILEAKQERANLRRSFRRLERENKELTLQSDIQGQLLVKTNQSDAHIEQLRSAIIARESIIGEKEKALRMAERQLEHHKVLLEAEIRRNATMSLLADTNREPLPDLSSLAAKEDIDRWVHRLRSRLRKQKKALEGAALQDETESQNRDLRAELDFYIREIIYYKLDIKGYKSDLKKLKHMATGVGAHDSRASEIESPTPSQARSIETPIRAHFSTGRSSLATSNTPSPISTGPISMNLSIGRPVTPPAVPALTPDPSPVDERKENGLPKGHSVASYTVSPLTPKTPTFTGVNLANKADNIDPGISPRSIARLSPERRKPTPPSPDQEKFGDLSTNFPLSTPASPKRHNTQRSVSDSIIQMYETPVTPRPSETDRSVAEVRDVTTAADAEALQCSASISSSTRIASAPDRPHRDTTDLCESAIQAPKLAGPIDPLSPPRKDVLAEAMRNSPDTMTARARSPTEQDIMHSTISAIRGLSKSEKSRSGSVVPAPLKLRPRAASDDSGTARVATPAPRRGMSDESSSSAPFVIGIPSPHNFSPIAVMPPSACSITGKSTPATIQSPSGKGISGTMASSTSMISPTEPTDTTKAPTQSTQEPAGHLPHTRSMSLNLNSMNTPTRNNSTVSSRSGGHARSASGSSIRSAMQLPGSLMKGKGKARKESISRPRPLDSPFDGDERAAERDGGIGRAI